MNRDRIHSVLTQGSAGQKVKVCGWVRSKRVSKHCAFIALNDGSSQQTLQLIVDQDSPAWGELAEVQTGASIEATGSLQASPAKGQLWEVLAESLKVLGPAPADSYPLQKKGHSLEFLREIAHLRPRTNTFGAMFRVRHVLSQAVHDFFRARGFLWAHTPIITASDCEGAGELFAVTTLNLNDPPRTPQGQVDYQKDFFGKPAFLTVSGQLEGEFLALSLGDVYTFGPTFRAENSNTTRHLAEFWMVEPEMAFTDLKGNMDVAEDFVRFMLKEVLRQCPEELQFFATMYKGVDVAALEKLATATFTRLPYTEAVDLLLKSKEKFQYPVAWGKDLQTEHERYLSEKVFQGPVIVYDYPKDIKSFYMRLNDDGRTVAAMDVLVPGVGELIGGSQREDRLDLLEGRMDALGISKANLQWYLDLRRFGSVPHAGFGLGFERMLMYVTGMSNIRDVILCPRTPGLVEF